VDGGRITPAHLSAARARPLLETGGFAPTEGEKREEAGNAWKRDALHAILRWLKGDGKQRCLSKSVQRKANVKKNTGFEAM